MPVADPRADRLNVARPVGASAGALGLACGWVGGAAIARLTGATAVVIVLVAGIVWFAAAALAGWWAIGRVRIGAVTIPAVSTQGAEFPISIEMSDGRPVFVDVRSAGSTIASGWSRRDGFHGAATLRRRGVVRNLHVRVRTPGALGLVWWARRFDVTIADHLVAPAPQPGVARIDRHATQIGGERAGRAGAVAGEIDGVRPWRDGDGEKSVHWASSLRVGELVVHDRRHDADERWLVRAQPGTGDPDGEAGRARSAMEQGLRSGADVNAVIGDGDAVRIPDRDAAARWTALADLGVVRAESAWKPPRIAVEPDGTAPAPARWWAAAATLVALLMLIQTLEYGPVVTLLTVAGIVAGAAVSARALATGEQTSMLVRTTVGVGALVAFLMVAVSAGRLAGLLELLRGPLPQILVILIALHGFECRDRRTVRVGLAISAVVVMYAAGFRVDGAIGWWLLSWAVCFGVAMSRLGGPPASLDLRPRSFSAALPRPTTVGVIAVGVGSLTSIAVLSVVPVPDGPARLTLPSFIEDPQPVTAPGAVAGPGGDVRDPGTDLGDDRAPAGQAGGYVGFASEMDTSVRGDLGDEVVMRVRATAPDFWRGQTFSRFDGRRWYVEEGDDGVRRIGPDIEVPPAFGDLDSERVPVDRFVQTFYAEQDLPNVVFAAYRPAQVIIEADVWTRRDGAIRASTTLPEGSAYTVVSARPRVTADALRGDGHIGARLNVLGLELFDQYLTVPPSTSDETRALAAELAEGQASTYDVVLAYEAWMAANVTYDLNAPLPDAGEDAVHDFLFDSRRGFCEQIASALTIMLRSQGVPARLATGYAAGERDRVAGVYTVRASDAHAWVEVWFPSVGWQPFDPTAFVPLSGEASTPTVGADLLEGARDAIAADPVGAAVTLVVLAMGVAGGLLAITSMRRRRRGRWGVLQDRFAELAARRGAVAESSNRVRSQHWTAADDAAVALEIAETLDRVAFDPTFPDDDAAYARTRELVGSLAGRRR